MHIIQGRVRDYAWGSREAIPALVNLPPAPFPVAELWLGGHAAAPSRLDVGMADRVLSPADLLDGAEGREARAQTGNDLRAEIARDPAGTLGVELVERFGAQLPYLLKLIAPACPLSMQVHPSKEQAELGFAREEAAGIARSASNRSYPDANHKPELVYALTDFEAIVGFRSPHRIISVLAGLGTPLTDLLESTVRANPNAQGVRNAFSALLDSRSRPGPDQVTHVVRACEQRVHADSPSPRADATVLRLARHYPGDPGVVASLLLNPVTLHPGEAMYTPAGTVHAYISGLGLEIMANSDNVLRAGLTPKHMDVPELLAVMQTVAAPPIRIAPEKISSVQYTYYAPVDDFELSVVRLRDANAREKLHGGGPRILLCLGGASEVWVDSGDYAILNTGQALFIRADDGAAYVRGAGSFVLAAVP